MKQWIRRMLIAVCCTVFGVSSGALVACGGEGTTNSQPESSVTSSVEVGSNEQNSNPGTSNSDESNGGATSSEEGTSTPDNSSEEGTSTPDNSSEDTSKPESSNPDPIVPEKPEVTTGDNFYFNLVESLFTAETYYLEMNDFVITVNEYEYDGDEITTGVIDIEIEKAQLQVALDSNGYLVGYGKLQLTESEKDDGRFYSVSGEVTVVLQDAKIYLCSEATYSESGETDLEKFMAIANQEEMFAMAGASMGNMSTASGMLLSLIGECGGIIDGIVATENNPLNNVLKAVVEYIFTVTETASGYHFELNFDRAEEIYLALCEQTIDELVDGVFGEGTYNDLFDYLTGAIDKTVDDIENDIKVALALAGIDLEDIYDLANGFLAPMIGEEEFDVRDYVEQLSEMTLKDILDQMSAEEDENGNVVIPEIDYKAYIAEAKAMLAEMTFMDLFGSVGGSGSVDSSNPQYSENDIVNSSTSSWTEPYGGKKNQKEDVEMSSDSVFVEEEVVTDYFLEELRKVVGYLKKSVISFDTDKNGALVSFTANLKGFGEIKTDEEWKEYIVENYYGDGWYSVSNPSITGVLNIVMNGTYEADYSDVVAELQQAEGVVEGAWAVAVEATKDWFEKQKTENYYYLNNPVYKDIKDGQYFDYNNYGSDSEGVEEEYNGQNAIRVDYYGDVFNFENVFAISVEATCSGWLAYSVTATKYDYVNFSVWYNADGFPIGVEIDEESLAYAEVYTSTIMEFCYNPKTGAYEYDKYTMHEYEMTEHKEPESCTDEGYWLYTCKHCKDQDKSTYTNGHSWQYEEIENPECNVTYEVEATCENCQTTKTIKVNYGHADSYEEYILWGETCEDGYDIYRVCDRCGMSEFMYSESEGMCGWTTTWEYFKGETVCGHGWAEQQMCACGKQAYFYYDLSCDMIQVDADLIDEETNHYIYTFCCDNEKCGYSYTLESYEEKVDNRVYTYSIYTFVVDGVERVGYDVHWYEVSDDGKLEYQPK